MAFYIYLELLRKGIQNKGCIMIKIVIIFICLVVSLNAFEREVYDNIHNAVKYKKLEILKKLSSEELTEALVYAVRAGDFDVIKALVKAGANINAYNDSDTSALYEAFRSENFNIVDYLLAKGAILNVKADYTREYHRIEPYLFKAIHNSNIRLVKNLLKYGINTNVKNKYNKTPLEYAIERKEISISEYFKNLKNMDKSIIKKLN
jgi:hypothetical protein